MIDESILPFDETSRSVRGWSRATAPIRLFEVGVAGALAAFVLVLWWLQPRPDIALVTGDLSFWLRMAYAGALTLLALSATATLAQGGLPRPVFAVGGLISGCAVILASVQAVRQGAPVLNDLMAATGGGTCLRNILALAAPMLAFSILGLRGIDLERPGLMGLAAGWISGAIATSVYGLHCYQSNLVFFGLWDTGGMALCAGVGAVVLRLVAKPAQT